ncbi:exodeoxyribonuclease III [Actinomycetaceae bacterium WB03_NA08]|uniref:Exodeoxyribonuclease III n=1 Tax=Scrofimicrobium canadense TaxID=2652290 RepID=A0A6N7W837_9ACTO|nr:exodeoxyribonuclease III [Scrofimicrobium canadense]MSS84602.1 exodeoxyribonuclease III [Scrofimicrobium canadense]
MRIATWNVNSARTRVDRIIAFLQRSNVDMLAMQEIKCRPDQFPIDAFTEAGYEVAIHGLNQWNGVAIASKLPLLDVRDQFPSQPTWQDTVEARALAATVESPAGPLTYWSLYIPNGREISHPHYQYKLEWLAALQADASGWLREDPDALIAMGGDWNVAPRDEDVWDIDFFAGATHVTPAEREAFSAFEDAGYREVTRPQVEGYTYWDYQQLRFPKNEGMRIDFMYASPALADRVVSAEIDRNERKGKGASDHVPVIVDWE